MTDKCICGYEYGTDWNENGLTILKGKKPFIKINGDFHVKKENNRGYERLVKVNLYACPECDTVKLNTIS